MKNSLRFARIAVTCIALLAGIDPANGGGDVFSLNHYILALLGNPVVPGSIGSATETAIGAPGAVATDANGNVFFATPGVVFKLDTGGNLSQIAGTGASAFSGDGGPARDALLNNMPYLNYPEAIADFIDFGPIVGGLAVDGAGNVYIADAYNNRVRKVDPTGVITTVIGDGEKGDFSDATAGSRPAFAPITWPLGIAVDGAGDLYVASAYGTLAKVTPDGAVTRLASANCGPGYLGPGLCGPDGIALDSSGNVYAADGYCRIREVGTDGGTITVAGDDTEPDGSGWAFTCGYNRETGKATTTALAWPYGVAIDKSGSLLIADTFNHCIRKVDTGGNISTIAGRCGNPGGSGDGGAATSATLNLPYGVAADSAGNVYIADSANYRVRKVSPDGLITTVAGSGLAPAPPADIDATYTGSWYDPAQNGQGLSIEVLPGNHILAYWYTFNPDGTQQAWLVGTGTYSGNSAKFDHVMMPTGGRWIPNFDPFQVVANTWGSLMLTFTDGNHGRADFIGNGYGTGSMPLTRLTAPAGPMTGAWSDPAQPGHGLVLESLPGDKLLAEWYAFDPAGTQQSWFLGVGNVSGNTATITAVDQPTGGRFIPNFDASKIVHNPWGSLTLTFTDCDHGKVDFASTAGYGSGSMNLTRLTRPAGVTCP